MTVETVIVVCVAIICATFLAALGIGAVLTAKKTNATKALTNELTNQITRRLKHNISK